MSALLRLRSAFNKVALATLCAFVLGLASPPSHAQSRDSVTLSRTLVQVHATVTDKNGRRIPGLEKDRFAVYEDGVRQEIAFFSGEDTPASIGIVFDLSGSMEQRINGARAALKRFVETSHPDDEYFLVGFADRPELLRDFTRSGGDIVNAVTLAVPAGSTALLDAAALAVAKVREARHARKAIVVISDGEDNRSRYTHKEFAEIVKESDALLYAIGISNPFAAAVDQSPKPLVIDPNRLILSSGSIVLKRIALASGGRAFFPKDQESLMEAFTEVALELRSQYSLGYYPNAGPTSDKYHKIKVTVDAKAIVRAREGYWGRGQ